MRVLVVDDNKDLADTLCCQLTELGLLALGAQTAQQGLALIGITPIDVVIADIQMPEMDGLRFVSEIHAKRPHIRVFLMTGNTAMATATISRHGVECVFEKPFDIYKIIKKIGKKSA